MKINIKKISLLLIIMFFALAPLTAFAADGDAGADDVPQSTVAKLQIPLPFVPENPDLSQYIQGVYRLLIGAGALFAVVMIIIGGYQWIFSGGSSDKTGAAKKRIFGAVIGLMLALLSYIILNTITPRLVALRLPKVDPVGRFDYEIGETCANSLELKKKEDSGADLKIYEKGNYPDKLVNGGREYAYCGRKHEVYAINRATGKLEQVYDCTGDYCTGDDVCVANVCLNAVVYGDIIMPPIQLIPWSDRYLEKIELVRYCTGGEKTSISEQTFRSKPGFYRVPRPDGFAGDRCIRAADKILGYYLKILVNDELGQWDDTFYTGKDRKIYKEMSLNSLISFNDLNGGYELNIDLSEASSYD